MPTYEYACPRCGTQFAEFKKINNRNTAQCPKCCHNAVNRLVSKVSIQSDQPVWLDDSVRGALQDPSERPIETRGEYNRYLEKNDVVPCG